ncbi:cyclic 2,3-diphosphoglycerate synthase [Methanobacterium ferruginis]|jgi:cyclic 2,3-diphosphoglycerate synthetase|uniref:cyclic 2,3-diphosphoglycerate synthase n=1 Tax=Methanobacterium ferruginis TaxID=710191 RepID=UPI002573B05C|nr:cyclic 2,3-diphosphoglycerate synthase [Methanobacterium ferruginis]MCC7550447.1 cyclic 2,3-diphosphoglycerate synthase [Methanobacterium sp.]BDZ68636.1 2,3-diphosphoglycerate synthetase [Methanobacterium ferruginis]
MSTLLKMVCLIDGEHYLPVTKSALDTLDNIEHIEVVAAVFIGGTEKLRDASPESIGEKLGVKVYFGPDHHKIPYNLIVEVAEEHQADVVMDLSDEPVVDYSKRFKIASMVLEKGILYEGPDFSFQPLDEYDVLHKPSLKILGTGKRIGKTAVSAYAARLIHREKYNPCVVAMGRGGPQEPEIVRGDQIEITPQYLMEQSDKGIHAASDHWEDALMSRILTIGCRRCGGGMVGQVFITNMKKGAQLANEVDADFVIMEGSGAAIPPIKTNRHIVLVGANQPTINIENFFGPYRIKMADLVVLTMCEEPMASAKKVERIEKFIKKLNPEATVIPTVFRPKPLESVEGKRVLFATTAPDSIKDVLIKHLEEEYGCEVVGTTPYLSNRPLLQKDIEKYIDQADVMLTELKAAAVDVATKDALQAGLEVVYCDNIPLVIRDEDDLDPAIIQVVDKAIADHK